MTLADEAGNRAGDVGADISDSVGVRVTSAEAATAPGEGDTALDTVQPSKAEAGPQLRLP